MKTTKNVKRYYAMNLYDGRIMPVSRELLTNPDYRVISENLAREIDGGKKNWKDVAFQLRQRDSMNPTELLKRAEQEKVKNLRPSIVTRENVEQFETKIDESEIGEVFDGEPGTSSAPAPDGGEAPADDGGDAPGETQPPPETPAKKSRKSSKKPAPIEEPAPADDGGDAPGDGVTL